MRNKFVVIVTCLIILIVSIAGCGAPSTTTSTDSPSKTSPYTPSTSSIYAPSSVKELTFTTEANPDFVFSDIKISDDVNTGSPTDLYLTGKIKNVGSTVFEKVEITVYLYDKDGVRLGETIGWINAIHNLKPGESAIFRESDFKKLFKNTVKVNLVAKGSSSPSFKKTDPDFVFSDMRMTTEGGYRSENYFTGRIKNVGNSVHEKVRIKANLFDKDGLRVGDAFTDISNLKPGETAIFKMYIWYKDYVASIVKWEMTAEDY